MHELVVIGGPVVVTTLAAFGAMQLRPFVSRRMPRLSARRRRMVLGLFLVDAVLLFGIVQWTFAQ